MSPLFDANGNDVSYVVDARCDCEGMCFSCADVGCIRCMELAE